MSTIRCERRAPEVLRRRSGRAYLHWLAVLALGLSGCASTPPENPEIDPFESFNRAMYKFNKGLDEAAIKPAAIAYQTVTPDFIDSGVTNFFGNLLDVRNAFNNLLQLKLTDAMEDVGRIAFNTTIGIGGFIDIASGLGMDKHVEDFGQTLGVWGVRTGPYIVWPVFGPSDVRDTFGLAVDRTLTSPLFYVDNMALTAPLAVLDVIDTRADLLRADRVVSEAVLDEYNFVRDAYLQRRRSLVYDGDPPDLEEEE